MRRTSNVRSVGRSTARGIVVSMNIPTPAVSTLLTMNWKDNAELEDGFRIMQASTETGIYSTVGTVASNVTTFGVPNLVVNTGYWFKVVAYNEIGESFPLGPSHIFTAPDFTLSGVFASAISDSSVEIDAVTPTIPPANGGYLVEYHAPADTEWAGQTTSPTLPVTITGIAAETPVTARIRGYNLNSDGTKVLGPVSATVTATTEATPAIADDFNRADGSLGANWSPSDGTSIVIESNQATATGALSTVSRAGTAPSSNQYSEITIGSGSGSRSFLLFVRLSGGNFYYFQSDLGLYGLLQKEGTGGTTLAYPAQAFANGDVVRMSAVGDGTSTAINLYVNGTLFHTSTDSSSPHTGGIYGFGLSASGGGVSKADAWAGGNI